MMPNATTERGTPARVCVAVPTFRRPEQLEVLLRRLAAQEIDAEKYGVRFVVIDNDTLPSAEPVVAEARPHFKHRVDYVHVPAPGLAVVRNFALNHAAESDDLLAMIDDDEIPGPVWLAELLRVQALTKADAVVGPVPAALPPGAPAWITRGRFFERQHLEDCFELDDGYSGNCLLALSAIDALQLRFDHAFNLLGGEDQLFFRQLVASGGRIVWAAGAIATETIPLQRASLRYLVALEFRKGNTLALCDLRINRTPRSTGIRLLKGLGLSGRGVSLLVPRSFSLGGAGAAKSLCETSRGLGMIAGLAGYRFPGYARARTEAAAPPSALQRVTIFDTSIASNNLGDSIIMEAVAAEVQALFPQGFITRIPTHDSIGALGRRYARKADVSFVGGTNLLCTDADQWKIGPADYLRIGRPVLLGVGWRDYEQQKTAPFKAAILRHVLGTKLKHSVRDAYTEKRLHEIGIRNVINTGCPTMWGLTEERCARVPIARAKNALLTLTAWRHDPALDRKWIDLVLSRYERVYFWPQMFDDLACLQGIAGDRVTILDANLAAYDAALDALEVDVIGTRLHGGIRALQRGRRAAILEVDNRAAEMSRDTGLLTLRRGATAALAAWIDEPRATRIQMPWEAIREWKAQFRSR
jgi:hypothetical protein